jgi:hypothetical protein
MLHRADDVASREQIAASTFRAQSAPEIRMLAGLDGSVWHLLLVGVHRRMTGMIGAGLAVLTQQTLERP